MSVLPGIWLVSVPGGHARQLALPVLPPLAAYELAGHGTQSAPVPLL
jgi:hypothetical protein